MDIGQEYKCDTGESPTKDVRFTVLQRVGGNSGAANWSYKIKGDSVCCLVQPSVHTASCDVDQWENRE